VKSHGSADHLPEDDNDGRTKHGETYDFQSFANRLRVGDRDRWRLGRRGFAARCAGEDKGEPGERDQPFPVCETAAALLQGW